MTDKSDMFSYCSSEATHEIVRETDHLPVFISSPFRNSCTPFTCKPSSECCTSSCVPTHWHEYYEFIYVLNDSMTAMVQADKYHLHAGDLLTINSGELHATKIYTRPMPYLLLQLSAQRLRELVPDLDQVHFATCIRAEEMKQTPDLKKTLEDLRQTFENHEDGYRLLFTSKLYEFLHILYCHYSCRVISMAEATGTSRDHKRVTEIVDWTQEHYREPLTLDDAAGHLGISREYFCRIFKKHTGQTYLEFLCSTRTARFYNELQESDKSIPLLMEEHGITNYKTFIRTFKDMYGTTPQKARQRTSA